jgi:plastocyanin
MGGLVQVIVAAALLLAGAATTQATQTQPEEAPPEPPTVSVRMQDDRFRPARITIAAGTTVLWLNEEERPDWEHNVISRDYRWASSNFFPGESYARTFDAPGTYRYFCDLHGGMTGVIIVE